MDTPEFDDLVIPYCPACRARVTIRTRGEVQPQEFPGETESIWWCPKCEAEVFDEGAIYPDD